MPKKPEQQDEKAQILDTMPKVKISVYFQTAGYTILIIAIFGAVGYYLDQRYDMAPKFTIASVLVSYPVTQIVLLKKIRKFATKKMSITKKPKK